ncbi:MAG: FtsW/RodA/SpoVE family cell cycle protein [Bacteroidales bacterium]|nr:FtsW/RodA/SpoVE family cell cycle protein [Bacteroidales bacterium]
MVKTVSKYFKGDAVIWSVMVMLCIFSMLAVYSATGSLAYKSQGGNTTYYLFRHSFFLIVGLGITFVTHLIPYRYYAGLATLFLYISIPLLVLTLILGTNINQASRWLTLPGIGQTFQTSDLAKLALIMYIAKYLSKKQDLIKDFNSGFLPIMIPVIIICSLIIKADFSTAAILFATSLVLLFIGRASLKHIFGFIGIGIVCVAIFIAIALNSENTGRIGTWKSRIENYVDGGSEGNYQVEQSKIAIVTGGFFGKGPGNSTQRNFLPQAYSDFIYSIIVEEYGIIFGGLPIIFLYLFLLFRAGIIVKKSERTFPAFLAVGLTFSLVFQAFVNIGVAVNIFPVTGQTLPMVSMGGTSVLFTSVAFGIILSVSRSTQKNDFNYELDEQDIQ